MGTGLASCAADQTSPPLTEQVVAQLMKKADDWQVPQPPPKSGMIKMWAYQSDKDYYSLGFVEPDAPNLALIGFQRDDIARGTKILTIDDPASCSLDNVAPTSPFGSVHGLNMGLVTGIQLIRMGNRDIGVRLIGKSLGEDSGHHRSNFKSPAAEPPILMLARTCLAAAMNDITTPSPDFDDIHAKVSRLVADQPELDSKATRWALKGLEASKAHKPASPGTMARIVDDYLMSGSTQGALSYRSGETSPAELALILKGFEAVPALLKQRDSKRFTNHLMEGFNNFVSYPMDAGQVVNAYLKRFANNELGSNWLRRQQGATAEDDAVTAWWKNASGMGEEAYVEKYAVVRDKDGKLSLSNELLIIANDRYPELLPKFYQTCLKMPHSSGAVDGFLAANDALPLLKRIELLKQGVATNVSAHRNSAIRLLSDLDPALADELLLKIVKNAPNSASEDYWLDQDANLGGLVSRTSDLEVWRALDALIKRADLGMRMELIDHLEPKGESSPEIIDFYLSILDRYLDDETIRDNSTDEKFSGPCAGFPFDQISVRNYINTRWAAWLKLELRKPEKGASKAQWADYRSEVGEAKVRYRKPLIRPVDE